VTIGHLLDDLLARIHDRSARVAVLGQGYVGLVVAMSANRAGFEVIGLELDRDRLAALRAGSSYVEDVTDEELDAALGGGYLPTDDDRALEGFDVAVIDVPTPLREGQPELSHIEVAAGAVGRALSAGALVILESTTYPGTTEELVGPILERESPGNLRPGVDFLLGYSPERIDPGNPSYGLAGTPKLVSGVDAASLAAVEAFLRHVRRQARAGLLARGGRAREAAREHLPARQHRARERDGDVRRRPEGGRLGGDRRRREQAVRLHALSPGSGGGRALPADRPHVPVMAGQAPAGRDVPLRRARE
jgi:threonine dehydrogenase-like Zn-dependent dehydrogenase